MKPTVYKEFVAELIGTMFIILFGDGVCAMNNLFSLGGYTNITFAWGIGVLLGILISNNISGAHLNPAVTLALVTTRRFPIKKLPHYVLAQMVGGFIGAAIIYYFYSAKLKIVDPTLAHSAGIFTTFPAVNLFIPSLMSEIIATAVLLYGILAIADHFNKTNSNHLIPFTVALLIVGIGMSFGGMHGYAMNPARDFSPRLFTAIMDFADNGITNQSNIWLVGVLGPIIGGPFGALLYDITLK